MGTRVVVVDDDVLLREGLASLLVRTGLDVIAQASDAIGVLDVVRDLQPDLLIIDIRMPPTNTIEGLVAAKAVRAACPDVRILVLSSYVEVEHAIDLLATGSGIGYLLKQRITEIDTFIAALDRIVAGESVIDPALVNELVLARRTRNPLDLLTAREREVLVLMAEGRSNLGISKALYLTEGTVEKHVHRILTKMDLGSEDTSHRRVLAVLTYLNQAH
ncbi:DNA-binding response regulator [Subtercola boreus]|uniref:DNA-binding response regulator n=1 Tax=Subtercola boreus TaxID=120213 RepID=A0A3E0VQH1_9MICO|nr:response regulator transcription factor [Subtercola boreus]RFA11780.1 DNA-binding response regulator [Subtercola boreus]